MSRSARWSLAMALVIALCGAAVGLLAHHLTPVPDARFLYGFAASLVQPIPVIGDAVGAWPLLIVFWIAVILVATIGVFLGRALARDERIGIGLILVCFCGIGLVASLWPVAFGGDLYASVAYGRLYGVYRVNPYDFTQAFDVSRDFILQQCFRAYGNPPPADRYGPLWTMIAGLLARIEAGLPLIAQLWSHRLLALVSSAASVLGLWRLWAAVPAPARKLRVAAFAFHPVTLFEAVAAGHNDAIMLAFGVWSFALAESTPLLAGLLMGAACSIKLAAFIAVPFFVAALWRKHSAMDALLGVGAAAAVVILSFVPFWQGLSTIKPIFTAATFPRTSPTWLIEVAFLRYIPGEAPVLGNLTESSLITLCAAVALAAVVTVSVVLFVRTGKAAHVWRSIAALLWSIPSIYPWYVIWLSPALSSRGAWATFTWWFALLAFVHYSVDVPRLPATTPGYFAIFDITVATTLAFLLVPIVIARVSARRARRAAEAMTPAP